MLNKLTIKSISNIIGFVSSSLSYDFSTTIRSRRLSKSLQNQSKTQIKPEKKFKYKLKSQSNFNEINISSKIKNQTNINDVKVENNQQESAEKVQSDKKVQRTNKYNSIENQLLKQIPTNLTIRNLIAPKKSSQIILLGVERRNLDHSSYLYDLIQQLSPDVIMTQLSCDLPYFIKTQDSFADAWRKFIQGQVKYKFIVNPLPKYLSDITLNNDLINMLVKGPLMKSTFHFQIGSTFAYTYNHITDTFETDIFFIPILHQFNNQDRKTTIIVNDFPYLKLRELIVEKATLEKLKEYHKIVQDEYLNENQNFDVQLLNKDLFIQPKVDYICETISQGSLMGKRILVVSERHTADLIEQQWQQWTGKITPLSKYYKVEYQHMKQTFLDYIEKHVILDYILEPLLRDNFIKYKSFPFIPSHTLSFETMIKSTFIAWEHYYRQYMKFYDENRAANIDRYQSKLDENLFREQETSLFN